MAIRRGFKVNVKANVEVTQANSPYLDIKEGMTVRVRFMPPSNPDGSLFTKIVNHFRLKTDDSPPRGMAVACNQHFNDEPCYLCNLSQVLKKHGDKAERQIGDDIRASARFYAPVLVAEKTPEGNWEYFAVKLLGLPKTAVEDITAILVQQDVAGDSFFCEAEAGQDMMITRTGTGFNTKYRAALTGVKNNLDEVYPKWADKYIEDVQGEMNLTFLGVEEQAEAARRTFGDDLDWDALASEFNL